MVLVLDGKRTAAAIKRDLAAQVVSLREQGIVLGLGTLLVGQDAGSVKYVTGKHKDCAEIGIASIARELPEDATSEQILNEIQYLNHDSATTGFIVQLPLPKGIDSNAMIDAIDPSKDADGMHPYNLGELVLHPYGEINTPLPCTPLGIVTLLDYYHIDLAGKHVVVLGRGITIGRTIGLLLTRKDINATVTLCHTGTTNVEEILRSADVVVAAMGQAHYVKPHMIRPDAVLIDVGVSRVFDEQAGRFRVLGDIDPACHEHCAAYSPNPGGVGPMTRAMLLRNVVAIAQREKSGSVA